MEIFAPIFELTFAFSSALAIVVLLTLVIYHKFIK